MQLVANSLPSRAASGADYASSSCVIFSVATSNIYPFPFFLASSLRYFFFLLASLPFILSSSYHALFSPDSFFLKTGSLTDVLYAAGLRQYNRTLF